MSKFIDQHIVFQNWRFTKWGRSALIVAFPALFLYFFLFAPGWWAHQRLPLPIELPDAFAWAVGLLIASSGLGLYLWTIFLFAKAHGTQVPVAPTQRVVATGPYAVSRNPMLTSAIIMVCGGGVLLDSWSFMLGGLMIPTAYIIYIRFVEEKELEARFGEEYLTYKKSTPFILPKIGS